MAKKKNSTDHISKFIAQRRSYLIGVLLGITLIVINSIIGLYVINLVLETGSESNIVDFEELPVPKIKEEEYINFRDDYIGRQFPELKNISSKDPFSTN